VSFPGPEELGRGLVVLPGAAVPAAFADAPRVTIDEAVLASPQVTAAMAAVLHEAWDGRRRIVVELAVPLEVLRAPEAERRPPYELDPGFTFERERLQFLVWANTYDGRKPGEPVWWHGVRASRLGATLGGPADVVLPDGTPAWCDGGPRGPIPRFGVPDEHLSFVRNAETVPPVSGVLDEHPLLLKNAETAVVIVHRDSRFQSLEDLRGARWAINEASSWSGYWVTLQRVGSWDFFGEVVEAGFHEAAMRMVEGTARSMGVEISG